MEPLGLLETSPERVVGDLGVETSAALSSSHHMPGPSPGPPESQPPVERSTASASLKLAPSPYSPSSLSLSLPSHSSSEVPCPPHLTCSYEQVSSSGSSGFVFLLHLTWLQTRETSSVQLLAGLAATRRCHHSKGGSRASFWG